MSRIKVRTTITLTEPTHKLLKSPAVRDASALIEELLKDHFAGVNLDTRQGIRKAFKGIDIKLKEVRDVLIKMGHSDGFSDWGA